MELMDAIRCTESLPERSTFSEDLRLVLRILSESTGGAGAERRQFSRCTYNVHAAIELTDPLGHLHCFAVVTRDVNQWGIGFVTQATLPVGSNAIVQMKGAFDADIRARGGIVRCREALPGWFEGAVLFEQEQTPLSPDAIQGFTSPQRPSTLK